MEEFLAPINANKELRPKLKNYPFTSNEIEITLFVINSNGLEIYDPFIGVATAMDNELIFKTIDPVDTIKYKSKFVEKYEEALKIINENLLLQEMKFFH